MKYRNSILSTAFVAMLVPMAAVAKSTFHVDRTETGTMNHVIPGTASRAQVIAGDSDAAARLDRQWEYLGGEAGWQLRPHSYEFRDGKRVHTDSFDHSSRRLPLDRQVDSPVYRYLERG